uniref:Uncharacterized protein n=1 Tax=Bionectria ochroleuca TaxID=29856 RepID=A0A8H7TN83_BIOOC
MVPVHKTQPVIASARHGSPLDAWNGFPGPVPNILALQHPSISSVGIFLEMDHASLASSLPDSCPYPYPIERSSSRLLAQSNKSLM